MYEGTNRLMRDLLGNALLGFGIVDEDGSLVWLLRGKVTVEGPYEDDEGCECFAVKVKDSPRGRFDMKTAAKKALMYSHLESK